MKMNPRLSISQLINYGVRLAQDNQPEAARRFFQKAIERDPHNIPALLWLTSISDSAEDGYRHLTQALGAEPHNPRTHAALRWNHWREQDERLRAAGYVADGSPTANQADAEAPPTRSHRASAWLVLLAALLVIGGSVASVYLGQPLPVSATAAQTPVALVAAPQIAPTDIAPPATAALSPTDAPTKPAATPTLPPTAQPTPTPTLPPTDIPTATPEPPTPVPPTQMVPTQVVSTQVVPTLVPPTDVAAQVAANPTGSNTEHWIDVDLSNQRLVAYEGDTPVYWVTVSTGLPGTPTVTGQYRIYVKYPAQTMSGPGYYLPDVPYVMYFYQGYGIHGTYWHNNFGHPMSHGCVNTPTPDAQWLYAWADVGTLINVHY